MKRLSNNGDGAHPEPTQEQYDGTMPGEAASGETETRPQNPQPGSDDMMKKVEIESESEKPVLKRTLALTGACAILISNVGSSSIFIAPTTVLQYAGSQGVALILWLVGGLVQLGIALGVVELALMFPKAGGPYFYIYQTFGKLPGFIFLWGFILFIAGSTWALASFSCSLYILSMIYTDCPPPDGLLMLLATFIMITIMFINCTYMKIVTSIQKFLTMTKLIALLVIVCVGLSFLGTETSTENLDRMMEGSHGDVGQLALGLFSGYFSFGGWQLITFMVEEIKNPRRVLPASILTSFAIIITAVVATIFSYGILLSKEDMLKSDAIAAQFGMRVHPALSKILSVLIVLCNLGSFNTLVMGQPRALYAAGQNNQMPKMMTLLHKKFKTPWPATFFLGILGFIMLQRGSIMALVDTIALYAGFMTLLILLCLLYLRWKRPDIPRPFKLPIVFPAAFFVLTLALMMMCVVTKPRELGIVVLVVTMAVPVYFVCIKWQKPARLFDYVDKFTNFLKLTLDLE